MSNKINVSIRVRPLLDWELKKQTQTSKLKVDPTNNQIRYATIQFITSNLLESQLMRKKQKNASSLIALATAAPVNRSFIIKSISTAT